VGGGSAADEQRGVAGASWLSISWTIAVTQLPNRMENGAVGVTASPDGQQWQRFPGNAGAAPGSKVAFDNFNAFADHYGTWVDRVGDENGSYLAVVENGAPAPWENRSLHVNSLSDPYNAYNILKLPEGWTIEVSEVQPGLGQPGRSIQVRIIGSGGRPTPIETLIEGGILGER
jgi:hypothetical protein